MNEYELKNKLKEMLFERRSEETIKNFLESHDINLLGFIDENLSLKTNVYCFCNDILNLPLCICGKALKIKTYKEGFKKYCSKKCADSDENKHLAGQRTSFEKYGTINPSQSDKIKKKIKETFIKKYGVDNPNKLASIKEKRKATMIEKYGEEYFSQTEEFNMLVEKTSLKKFGTKHPSQATQVRDKFRDTCIKKYGVDNPNKDINVIKKRTDTNMKLYNVSCYMKTNEFKEKTKEFLRNISDCEGINNIGQIDEIKEKIKRTKKSNYIDIFKQNLKNKDFELLSSDSDIIEEKEFVIKCNFCSKSQKISTLSIQRITCECRLNISQYEKQIVDWLKSLNIDVIENDRTILNGKELDIYIPKYKLAIEFDGLYWHCELNKPRDYHLTKTLSCKEKDIQLIHVFENEWAFKQDIVKSIIKTKLGILDEKIFARKCIVKEIKQQEYNQFLDGNHLQGKSIAKTRLGLFYNDELVSVMGFGKSRFKKDEVELIRFANKLNASIIGGFSKLLKYYIIQHKPDKLISYCDLRYFDGSGYLKNGFEIVSMVPQNYYYWKKDDKNIVLYSRMQFQKHKLKDKLEIYDENLSEHENMLNNGYLKIFDCGNLKLNYKGIQNI